MKSRLLLNLLLLALVAGLVWLAVHEPGRERPAPPLALTSLTPEEITRIRIERADHPGISLEKTADEWRVTAPLQMPANTARIESLLRLVAVHSSQHYKTADIDPAALQLVPLSVSVTFNDLRMVFGGTDPLQGRRYVQIGDIVHLVDDQYIHLADSDAAEFVDLRLLTAPHAPERIVLPDLTLTRQAEGGWQADPAPADIGADRLQALADAWQQARAIWVDAYREMPALGTVHIGYAESQADVDYTIVAREPELILARPDIGIQYHLGKEQADMLMALSAAAQAEP